MQTPTSEQFGVRRGNIGYEEFLRAYSAVQAEWVNGEVIMVPPASDLHQNLVDFLGAILHIYIETYDLGWVRSALFQRKAG